MRNLRKHSARTVVFEHIVFSASLLGIALGSNTAHAQATEESTSNNGIQDIVVTAQKREQRLQDVPLAVTAVSLESLQSNRVQNVMDLTGLAPGLLARPNAGSLGSPSFSMRGVFASASQPSSDRQISTYIDGVYIGATRGSVFDLPDIERIEVLRGPQGTLFGRNATAGAVNVVTRNPKGEFAVRQEVTIGNYDQFRTRTTIDLPAVGALSAYVSYVHDERRGDVRNLGAGVTFDRTNPFSNAGVTKSPKWLGDRNAETVFAAVRFEPSSDFSLTYKFDWSSADTTPEARAATAINPNSLVGNMLLGVLAAQPNGGGAYGPVVLNPSDKRPRATNNGWTQPGFIKTSGHNLTAELRVSDSISIKNVMAYRTSEAYGPSTLMGINGLEFTAGAVAPYARFATISTLGAAFFSMSPAAQQAAINAAASRLTPAIGSYLASYEGNSYGKGWQISNELQVNYDSDPLTLTVGGLIYESREINGGLPGMAPNFAFRPVFSQLPLGNLQDAVARTSSLAVYAQGEVHITPRLDLVVGGRYTRDEKDGSLTSGGTFVGDRNGEGDIIGKTVYPWRFKKAKPTYSVGLNYKPTDDILLYGKYSTAFLSGGAVGSISFEPETVASWEGGIKSDWFDHRLRVNIALFDAKYKHSQSSQSGTNVGRPELGVVVIDNGPLKARGAEVEVTIAPTNGLSFSGSMGYTEAKLTNPNPVAAQGKRFKLVGVPAWIGNVNAQYTSPPLFGDANLFLRLDGNYQGKYRAIPDPDIEVNMPIFAPYEFTRARWIVNGRLALQHVKMGAIDGEIALWGRNLLNNRGQAYTLLFGDIAANSSYQPARTFGADFIVNF